MLARYLTYLHETREAAFLFTPLLRRLYANRAGEGLLSMEGTEASVRRLVACVLETGDAVVDIVAGANLTFAPVFDERGRVDAVFGLRAGLPALPRVLHALQEPMRTFARLVHALPAIVMTARPSGAIDFLNARWYDVTGQRRVERPPAQSFAAGIAADRRVDVLSSWADGVMDGLPFTFELRLESATGARWFELRAEPLRASGRIVKWVAVLRDIDERRQAYERERLVADTLQRAMLPTAMPRVEGVTFDVAYSTAARERLAGGDWYDAFDLGDRRVGIAIGDVTGHGLDAAIVMSRLRQIMRAASLEDRSPEHVLGAANRVLFTEGDALASAFYGVLDTVSMRLCYASAGHPPPLIAGRGGSVRFLEEQGVLLGVAAQGVFRTGEAELGPDSALVLYTDGVVEAGRDIVAGERRLADAVAAWARGGFAESASELQRMTIGEYAQADDAAMLVLRFPAARRLSVALPATPENAQRLRRAFARFLAERSAGQAGAFEATLAVAEAVNNAVFHAYRDRPGDVHLAARRVGDRVVASVRDAGEWSGNAPVLPGHGLDIMEKLLPGVQIRRSPRGSTVSFRIPLPVAVEA